MLLLAEDRFSLWRDFFSAAVLPDVQKSSTSLVNLEMKERDSSSEQFLDQSPTCMWRRKDAWTEHVIHETDTSSGHPYKQCCLVRLREAKVNVLHFCERVVKDLLDLLKKLVVATSVCIAENVKEAFKK